MVEVDAVSALEYPNANGEASLNHSALDAFGYELLIHRCEQAVLLAFLRARHLSR
eukprot:SAG31_NODE_1054_length_10140_cov_4.264316_9_plen_55_part_00